MMKYCWPNNSALRLAAYGNHFAKNPDGQIKLGNHLICLQMMLNILEKRPYYWIDNVCYGYEPPDATITSWAARGGKLEHLKFLVEYEVPIDERACFMAARKGHYDCLVYTWTHGGRRPSPSGHMGRGKFRYYPLLKGIRREVKNRMNKPHTNKEPYEQCLSFLDKEIQIFPS